MAEWFSFFYFREGRGAGTPKKTVEKKEQQFQTRSSSSRTTIFCGRLSLSLSLSVSTKKRESVKRAALSTGTRWWMALEKKNNPIRSNVANNRTWNNETDWKQHVALIMTLVFFVAFKIPFLELAQLEMTRMFQWIKLDDPRRFRRPKNGSRPRETFDSLQKKIVELKNEDPMKTLSIPLKRNEYPKTIEILLMTSKKTGEKGRKRDVPDLVEHSIHGKQKQKEPQSNSKDVPRRRFIDDEQHSVKSTLLGCKGKKSGQSPPRALEKMVLITGWNKMFQTSVPLLTK